MEKNNFVPMCVNDFKKLSVFDMEYGGSNLFFGVKFIFKFSVVKVLHSEFFF